MEQRESHTDESCRAYPIGHQLHAFGGCLGQRDRDDSTIRLTPSHKGSTPALTNASPKPSPVFTMIAPCAVIDAPNRLPAWSS